MSLFGSKKAKSATTDKIGALKIQSQGYGNVVPMVYGMARVSPTLFFYGNFISFQVKNKTKSSGKGMGSGAKSQNTTQYCAAIMLGLACHEISNTGKLWVDKKKYNSATAGNYEFVGGILFNRNFNLYTGTQTQNPWGYLSTYEPTKAVHLRGFSYMAINFYLLGDSATLGNHSVEVKGLGSDPVKFDANPADIISHLLNNQCNIAVDGFADYKNLCATYDVYFSLALTEQQQAGEVIKDILNVTSSELVFKNGVATVVPYFTAGAIRYHLTELDYLAEKGQVTIKPTRKKAIDCFNHLKLEFLNRDNDYNIEIVEAKDLASIETIGLRTAETITAHFVTHPQRAKNLVEVLLQRDLNNRNTYEFTLSIKYIRLEPMDVVTLTDASLGLNQRTVIIKKIVITPDWQLQITAEDYNVSAYEMLEYAVHQVQSYIPDYTGGVGNINAPVIFAAPKELAQNGLEIWIAASSSNLNYGGCEVHISLDGGTSYEKIGTIDGSCRMGVLTADLPVTTQSLDTTNTLSLNMVQSNGILNSVDSITLNTYGTLSRVGNEFIAYQTATLTSPNQYDITTLRRGLYDSNQGAITGDSFVRCDDSLFKYAYNAIYAGRPVKLKFPSYNHFGEGLQDLATVPAYDFTIPQTATWDSNLLWDNQQTLWWN